MIGFLRGEIRDLEEGKLILLTKDGVGYQLSTPVRPALAGLRNGAQAEFFVYTHVREDQLDLYGFPSAMEKQLFLILLSVSGVGPKVALSVLSAIDPEELVNAILEKNKDLLCSIPGIGKKTAERLVLELSDGIQKKIETGVLRINRFRTGPGPGHENSTLKPSDHSLIRDTKMALISLGYRENEARDATDRVQAELKDGMRVEDLVRLALRKMRN